ncbi:MAG TPA: hypothetical protein VKA68_05690, partial [bacterium]|nr:hypothetical protein [bacterium]
RHSAFVGGGVIGRDDFEDYMKSLHLPEDVFAEIDGAPYQMIPGDDRPGDYAKPGTEFQPIEAVEQLPSGGPDPLKEHVWFYNTTDKTYNLWEDGSWSQVDRSALNQVLDDKAYINPPNNTGFAFLNPRQVFFGIRFWF